MRRRSVRTRALCMRGLRLRAAGPLVAAAAIAWFGLASSASFAQMTQPAQATPARTPPDA